MTEAEFLKDFKYDKGRTGDGFRDIRKSKTGDCDDFAFTILLIRYGWLRAILKSMFSLKLVWSPSNGLIPRHVVLKDNGLYIDSTRREWRKELDPHKRPIPLGPLAPLMIIWGLFN
jgi:hypothetical protein